MQSAVQAADAQQNQTPPQVETPENQATDTAAMDEAAKEASLMLLDKILGEENQPKTDEAKTEDKPKPEAKVSKPKEEKPAKAKPATTTTKPAEKPAVEPETDDEPEAKPTPRRRPLTSEKITEVASKAAAQATAETLRQLEENRLRAEQARQAQAAQQAEEDVPETLKEDVERLREVQKLHASEYKGRDLAKEFLESSKRESDYERKWRKENPGRQFNWDDPEHEEFIDTNAIEVDEDHLKEADRSILKEQAIREAEERFAQKYGRDIEEVRRSRAEAQLAPIRQQVDHAATTSLLEAIRPDLVEEYGKDRNKVVEEIKNDPIAMEAVTAVEQWSMPALDAAVRVLNNPTAYSVKSPEVQFLAQAAMRVENVIASVPREDRPVTEDGRRFATLRDYNNMPASQRSKYYTVQDEDLVPQLIIKAAAHEASVIKSNLEKKAESFAKRMGFVKQESNSSQKPAAKSSSSPSAPSVKAMPNTPVDSPSESSTVNGLPKSFWESIGINP